MEEQKTLILSLEFQTDEALQRAADLRTSIDADKAALQELNKTIKESGEVTKAQALSREKLEQSIRANTKARGDELRAIDHYIKATKAQLDQNGKWTGSIKEMRSAIGFLTEQWNGLSREERENAQVGGVLQKEIKSLSDELKELEGSVGDNRRSVGGYLDAIRQAPGAMGKFRAGVDGISAAMKANPLGLIMQFLPQITALFNSSGEGADAFAKVMGSVNAIIQEGLKRIVGLGGAVSKMLSGDFKGAFEEGKKSLTGFGDAITRAVNEGGALAETLDALEEKERAFGLAGAETEQLINKLLIQSRNRQTSEADRIKLLERAEKLELDRNKQEIALAKQRVELVKRENAAKQEDADVQDERLKKAQENVIKLQTQTDSILEKIQNRKDQLRDAAEEKERARREKAEKEKQTAWEKDRARMQEEVDANLKRIQAAEEAAKKSVEEEVKFQKGLEEQFKRNEELRKKEDKEKADALALEIATSKQKVDIKKAEFQAISTLAQAAADIANVIASENEELAVFQKAVAGFQIAMNMAQAVAKLTASATEVSAAVAATSGPLGVITGPLAYAAYYGTQIAAIVSGMAQAKQLLNAEPPKKMAEGGLLDGPSHAAGGIKGTGSFANVEVEGGEAVINKRSTARFAGLLDFINQAGGGKPLGATNYAAAGGILSPAAMQPLTGSYMSRTQETGIDYNQLAKAMAAQPVYVRPTEIVSKANQTNARKAKSSIG